MDNPERKRKPLPGDIQDRAHAEMAPVRAASTMLCYREPSPQREPDRPPRVSAEAARDIMKQYGFSGAVNIGGKFNE